MRQDPCTEQFTGVDRFRTLATDTDFQHIVGEDMLLRLLDAFAWKRTEGTCAASSIVIVREVHDLLTSVIYLFRRQS
jgi:nicotinic acid mononucleotide adenylyltransferase